MKPKILILAVIVLASLMMFGCLGSTKANGTKSDVFKATIRGTVISNNLEYGPVKVKPDIQVLVDLNNKKWIEYNSDNPNTFMIFVNGSLYAVSGSEGNCTVDKKTTGFVDSTMNSKLIQTIFSTGETKQIKQDPDFIQLWLAPDLSEMNDQEKYEKYLSRVPYGRDEIKVNVSEHAYQIAGTFKKYGRHYLAKTVQAKYKAGYMTSINYDLSYDTTPITTSEFNEILNEKMNYISHCNE